jgi:hypothetical protein
MTKLALLLVILAIVFLVLSIFTQLPLWISVAFLCTAFALRDGAEALK